MSSYPAAGASTNHKEMMLSLLMHYMSMETRAICMREIPQAYNACVGQDVVSVVRNSDGRRY